jgi:hypothetical protein
VSDEQVTMTLSKATWNALFEMAATNAEVQGYGHFPGGDPRDFDPDPECSTEEERAAHKRDCEAMNAGGQALMPPTAVWGSAEGMGFHYHRAAYGLGGYVMRDEEWTRIRDEMKAAAEKRGAR